MTCSLIAQRTSSTLAQAPLAEDCPASSDPGSYVAHIAERDIIKGEAELVLIEAPKLICERLRELDHATQVLVGIARPNSSTPAGYLTLLAKVVSENTGSIKHWPESVV
jgi:hypothetical protein